MITPWTLIILVITAVVCYAPWYAPWLGLPQPNPLICIILGIIGVLVVSVAERAVYVAAVRAAWANGSDYQPDDDIIDDAEYSVNSPDNDDIFEAKRT